MISGKGENHFLIKFSWGRGHSEQADHAVLHESSSLTVIRSSLSSRLAPSLLQEIVGSGCPRGGWHSRTAGSPTATITSTGFCLKSSRKTETHRIKKKWKIIHDGFKQNFICTRILKKVNTKGLYTKTRENSVAVLLHPSCCSSFTNLLRKLAAWMADSKIRRCCRLLQSTRQKGEIWTAPAAHSRALPQPFIIRPQAHSVWRELKRRSPVEGCDFSWLQAVPSCLHCKLHSAGVPEEKIPDDNPNELKVQTKL